jgi:hypothetical protein
MTLSEFLQQVPNFHALTPRDKIAHFGWFLHAHKDTEVLTNANVRGCFNELHIAAPNLSIYLPRMEGRELLRTRGGFKLEGNLRREFDAKYGDHPTMVAVTSLLGSLPSRVPSVDERDFLKETINCYRVGAYRAAIVMTWCLAFDHVLRWIVVEKARLDAFNSTSASKFPKKAFAVSTFEDFEEVKDADVIEICRTSAIIPKSTVEILRERLKRRNLAAHPSNIVISQPQADDLIFDLVNNVVLALK